MEEFRGRRIGRGGGRGVRLPDAGRCSERRIALMRITLKRLTVVAWLAWLLMLIAMAGLSLGEVFHPSFLYMAIPLAVQLISTVAVVGGGTWRLARGPRRWIAATWILLALLPMLWMAAGLESLYRFAAGRNHPPTTLTRLSWLPRRCSPNPTCGSFTHIATRASVLFFGRARQSPTQE